MPTPKRSRGSAAGRSGTAEASASAPTLNMAVLAGTLIAEPVITELSTGEIVASLSVRSTDDKGRRHSSPVRWLEPGAAVHRLHADQEVVVVGCVSRRFFRSGGQVISRTEVEASHVLRRSQKVTRIKALESAAGVIAAFADAG